MTHRYPRVPGKVAFSENIQFENLSESGTSEWEVLKKGKQACSENASWGGKEGRREEVRKAGTEGTWSGR